MARQTVYVDIVQRGPFSESNNKRQVSPLSVSIPGRTTPEPPSPNPSPRKKQKLKARWEQDEFGSSTTCVCRHLNNF